MRPFSDPRYAGPRDSFGRGGPSQDDLRRYDQRFGPRDPFAEPRRRGTLPGARPPLLGGWGDTRERYDVSPPRHPNEMPRNLRRYDHSDVSPGWLVLWL